MQCEYHFFLSLVIIHRLYLCLCALCVFSLTCDGCARQMVWVVCLIDGVCPPSSGLLSGDFLSPSKPREVNKKFMLQVSLYPPAGVVIASVAPGVVVWLWC